MKMLRFILLTVSLLGFAQTAASAEQQGVIAIVNKEVITNSDLTKRMNLVIALSGMHDSSSARQAIRAQVIQTLIDEKLIEKAASGYKLEVDVVAVKNGVARLAAANRMSGANQLYDYVRSKGGTPEEFDKQLRYQLIQSKLLSAIIEPTVNISDLELQEATKQVLQELKVQNTDFRYHLAEIVLFPNNPGIDQLIIELQTQLSLGADFSNLAKEFSQSTTAEKGGEVGWVMKSQLPPEIAAIVTNTSVGSITQPIHTKQGYFIIKVLDKKNNSQEVASPLAPEEIRNILWQKKVNIQFQTYMQKLRLKSFVELK